MRSCRPFGVLCLVPLALLLGSCGGPADMPAATDPACFAMPTNHNEIINSCDSGTSYDIPATLAKLAPGAPLMPLP